MREVLYWFGKYYLLFEVNGSVRVDCLEKVRWK